MKVLIASLVSSVSLCASCIPNGSASLAIETADDRSNPEEKATATMSLNEIKSVCRRLANFRDQLEGITDPRVSDEVLLSNSVGGYGYVELLYIVRRYGDDVGIDEIYEKCHKFLYVLNDGEYSGSVEEVIPGSKLKFEGHSQEWLLTS